MTSSTPHMIDAEELSEWQASVDDVASQYGEKEVARLLEGLLARYQTGQSQLIKLVYENTYSTAWDTPLAQNDILGVQAEKINLWNAMAMVVRAGKNGSELGGHISTYASSSTLYRIGFDYCFVGDDQHRGDLVYFQGHAAPGMYARSYLEGRLRAENLDLFRQEAMNSLGISSYPHPWLMPEYWQFPTVSMGLGPLQAIYQAAWQQYLLRRGLGDGVKRRVWAFCGDGEMDEPESTAALAYAASESLDNCIFVVNCNLQRLDGPVRGNGQIILELAGQFQAAGWQVIQVMWGCGWDRVWALDKNKVVINALSGMVDGQLQALYAQGTEALIDFLCVHHPETAPILKQLTVDEVKQLLPGGHDPVKVHTAYRQAMQASGRPTVILAHTIKGFQLGGQTHGRNIAHNKKKMSAEDLQTYARWCGIPLSTTEIESAQYYHPGQESPIVDFILKRRRQLQGFLPKRRVSEKKLTPLDRASWTTMLQSSGDKASSTTMAYVRLLNTILRDQKIRPYLVPIVADEARTFGMEGLFKKIGIYASSGQQYRPEDTSSIMSYHEKQDGQLIQAGLTEAGAMAAWLAAATSYTTSNQPVIPMFIFYSMFGFQRVGDLLWCAGDSRARGFLFGATAGRTTLGGEGLQHNDGHSLVMASLVPNCISYDPCYQYELAVIVANGIQRMMISCEDVYFYITLMTENYPQPAMPDGVEAGIIQGMYPLPNQDESADIQLLASGAILREAIAAALQLRQLGFRVKVFSVTSFTELARQAAAIQRRVVFEGKRIESYVAAQLGADIPAVAATDYVCAYAEQIRPHIQCPYHVLGTDGFGRSDTRSNLRKFFGVDAQTIVYQSVWQLVEQNKADPKLLQKLRTQLDAVLVQQNPTQV